MSFWVHPSKSSQVCIRQADSVIVLEKKHPTIRLAELMKTWPVSRVILETSSEAFRIADAALAAGHEVRVVPATLVRQLGVGDRSTKTDERDARRLSEVSCRIDLPSVHVPSERSRQLRSQLRSRETLVETRTKTINHVRGWLRQQLLKLGRGTTMTLPERARLAATNAAILIPVHIERVLQVIELLNVQVLDANKQLLAAAKECAVCRRLMTIPGVGPVTAVGFVASIDDPSRFARADRVPAYLGLTPGENSSSERQRRTGITKAGPTSVRRVLIQAAWTAWRYPNEPMTKWARRVAERRGTFVAIVALARKMSTIMFALWRDKSEYRSAARTQETRID
jgi:transposase